MSAFNLVGQKLPQKLSLYSPPAPPCLYPNRSVNAQFAPLSVKSTKARTVTTASALPLAEIAAVGPEIAEVAVTCTLITLVGLAIGFVLLRVEAAVEGEE